jgi:hypothetical protein
MIPMQLIQLCLWSICFAISFHLAMSGHLTALSCNYVKFVAINRSASKLDYIPTMEIAATSTTQTQTMKKLKELM